jgi:hypothetical protein
MEDAEAGYGETYPLAPKNFTAKAQRVFPETGIVFPARAGISLISLTHSSSRLCASAVKLFSGSESFL